MTMTPRMKKNKRKLTTVMEYVSGLEHEDGTGFDPELHVVTEKRETSVADRAAANATPAPDKSSERKSKTPPVKDKRKRGRPVGSISKTDEMRVTEQRKYQQNVQECFPNLRKNELTGEINYNDPSTGELKTMGDKEPGLVGHICTIDHGKYVPPSDGRTIAMKLAEQHAFNPIHSFLEKALTTPVTSEAQQLWDSFDQHMTGRNDEHHRKTLQ